MSPGPHHASATPDSLEPGTHLWAFRLLMVAGQLPVGSVEGAHGSPSSG